MIDQKNNLDDERDDENDDENSKLLASIKTKIVRYLMLN